jgi:hypothetical protein
VLCCLLGSLLTILYRWWINSLFAHHAGIIGKESLDGGTTFDDHGAYAVVIKEENEVDTRPDGSLRYLTSMNDRGRFRLTAATPKSREPIRVLRSRNDNGIWGPRAGIRFDGLVGWPSICTSQLLTCCQYVVRGWSVRLAKDDEAVSGHLKPAGGISYEVVLQRNDEVPLEEVLKRPTNADLDDYMEYDRLRQKHYGLKRQIVGPAVRFSPQLPVRDMPPIQPISVAYPSSDSTISIPRAAVDPSMNSMPIYQPVLNSPLRKKTREAEACSSISPRTSIPRHGCTFNANDSLDAESPTQSGSRLPTEEYRQTQSTNNLLTDTKALKEIIPWIDQDPDLESLPPSVDSSTQSGNGGVLETDSSSHASSHARQEPPKREWTRIKTIGRHAKSGSRKKTRGPRDPHAQPQDPEPSSPNPEPTRSTSFGQYSRFFSAHDPRAIVSSHRLISARSISSMRSDQSNRSKTKILHGGGDSTNDSDDYFSLPTHDARVSDHSRPSTPKRSHEMPMNSPSGFVRTSVPDSYAATSTRVPGKSLEIYRTSTSSEPLMNFITRARPASPVGSPASTSVIWRGKESRNSESVGSELHTRDDLSDPIVFSNPFTKSKVQRVLRRWSSGVAPDIVG